MQPIEVVADGVWLSLEGDVADAAYSFTRGVPGTPGGCEQASWTFGYPAEHTPPMLRRGATVKVHDGSGVAPWGGLMSEPERDGDVWRCFARGYAFEANRFPAIDATGTPTTDADAALAWAVSEGLPWVLPSDTLFAPVMGPAETVAVNSLADLLDYAATQQGTRWWVDADAVLHVDEDPTSVAWVAAPEVLPPGVADDDYVSRLYGRYITALAGTPPTASSFDLTDPVIDDLAEARWGPSMRVIDYTNLNVVLDPLDIAADLTNRLKLAGARMGYTNPLTLTRDVLTTLGDVHAAPATVKPWDGMLRLNRFLDVAGNLALGMTTDVVMQRTVYSHADDAVTVELLGMVPRDLEGILAAPEAPETRGVEING